MSTTTITNPKARNKTNGRALEPVDLELELGEMHSPLHPGEVLADIIESMAEELGKPFTVKDMAEALDVSVQLLSSLIRGRSSVTPDLAFRLSIAFANTRRAYWMDLQTSYDLAEERKRNTPRNVRVIWDPPPID